MIDSELLMPVDIDNLRRRDQNIIKNLTKISIAHDGAGGAKIASCIVRKNRVVAYGLNSIKTDPLQGKFGKNPKAVYIHSEISAIKNSLKEIDVEDFKETTMFIVRTKKDGSFGLAKPCGNKDHHNCGCISAIIAFEIPKVIFTSDIHNHVHIMDF